MKNIFQGEYLYKAIESATLKTAALKDDIKKAKSKYEDDKERNSREIAALEVIITTGAPAWLKDSGVKMEPSGQIHGPRRCQVFSGWSGRMPWWENFEKWC